MARFVLEIGTEELPARFLADEQMEIKQLFTSALAEAGLEYEKIFTLATPRRLAIIIDNLADMQPEKEEILTGPPVVAAYDQAGNPTKALLGFASGHGAAPEEIFRHHTEKGEYIALRKKTGGKKTAEVLAEVCPRILASLSFPKRMRWGKNKVAWARPLRWILALLDDKIVPFSFGPIQSGRETFGHRVHALGAHVVNKASEFEAVLEKDCHVQPSMDARKKIIHDSGNDLAKSAGGEVIWKDSLLDEVAGLVEMPMALLGDFDPAYLEIPAEALLTSMEVNQKSFGLRNAQGRLLPHFLTFLNLQPEDMAVVKRGWERVLRARLEDARFFWNEDLRQNPELWLQKLEHVIFIGPLGSMREKASRLEKLCAWLGQKLGINPETIATAEKAGLLAKTDLVSAMVGEFDTLQGIMGGIYAVKFGESEAVGKAIKEQYLPAGPDTPLPDTQAGCILSISDRADTLAGCFGLNMIPTGAADPNGLRRCALGIIRILLHCRWHLDVKELFREARKLYGDKKWKLPPDEALSKLMDFFTGRLRNYLLSRGYDTVMTDAILAAGADDPVDVVARLDALAAFSVTQNYQSSVQTLKRVDNITRKCKIASDVWQKALLTEDAEKSLAEALAKELPNLDQAIAKGEYQRALQYLENLKNPIDNFFDKVMVLCEDEKIRDNRLAMLNGISSRYANIAKFAMLQI